MSAERRAHSVPESEWSARITLMGDDRTGASHLVRALVLQEVDDVALFSSSIC